MTTMIARYAGTCGDCKQRFMAGTMIEYDRGAPKGLKSFHVDCSDPQKGFSARIVRESDALTYYDGDARPFVQTRYGMRCWRGAHGRSLRRCAVLRLLRLISR